MERLDAREMANQLLATAVVLVFIVVCILAGRNQRLTAEVINEYAQEDLTTTLEETNKRISTYTKTVGVPADYFAESSNGGRVETLTYEAHDRTQASESAITKTALVYLPPGYDENDERTRYNIFYWLHGWQMTNNEFLHLGNDGTVHILDHMIANGEIEPMIIVSMTFDKDNASQDWERSVAEMELFPEEWRRELVPAVETKYRTYANSTELEDLILSREHRGFGGFSLGGAATWKAWEENRDIAKYFAPQSMDSWAKASDGSQTIETVDYLESKANENRDFVVIQMNGTKDLYYEQIDKMIAEMQERSKTFNNDNLMYMMKIDGEHDMEAIWEYVYNVLPKLFMI